MEKNNSIKFAYSESEDQIKGFLSCNGICVCDMIIDIDSEKWSISRWHTEESYRHRGYGKYLMYKVLSFCLKEFGIPREILYIWNGENEYVFDFITKNFNAVCLCPIEVQKTQGGDDWLSHQYNLNVQLVLDYFEV